MPDEPEETDPQIARKIIGGADVVRFEEWFYRKLARYQNLEGALLSALDTGGFVALVELLAVYHLDSGGGYSQIEYEPPPPPTKEEIEEYRELKRIRKARKRLGFYKKGR
jgi:hypothetical protein